MTRKRRKHKGRHRTVKGVKQKRCIACEKWKPESDFHKDRRARADGLKARCKDCTGAHKRELKRKNGKETRQYLTYEERHRTFRGVKQKLCCRCKEWRSIRSQ